MKSICVLLIVISAVLFYGCGSKTVSHFDYETGKDVISDGYDTDNNENSEDFDGLDEEAVRLNEKLLKNIGKSSEQLEEIYGKIAESIWFNGPLYRFSDSEVWFGFEDFKQVGDSEKYEPVGRCNYILAEFGELVKDPENEYSAETLSEATGEGLVKSYDEMDMINVYSVEYKDYIINLEENSNGTTDKKSTITIGGK